MKISPLTFSVAVLLAAFSWSRASPVHALCPNPDEFTRFDVPNAYCNDGTPMVAYFRAATAGHEGDWHVHLEGGESCSTDAACLARYDAATAPGALPGVRSLVTSAGLPACDSFGGIFSRSTPQLFSQFNQVYVRYCSSDVWTGDTTHVLPNGQPFIMNGHGNLVALFSAVAAFAPDRLLFSGSSAGSEGVSQFFNEAVSMLPNTDVYGFRDSTLTSSANALRIVLWGVTTLAVNPFTGSSVTPQERASLYATPWAAAQSLPYADLSPGVPGRVAYWNAHLDSACVAANPVDPESCDDARVVSRHHTRPVFFFQFGRDRHWEDTSVELTVAVDAAVNPFWAGAFALRMAEFHQFHEHGFNRADVAAMIDAGRGDSGFVVRNGSPMHTAAVRSRYSTSYGGTVLRDMLESFFLGGAPAPVLQ